MPRYFVHTASEKLVVSDEEGIDLPHIGALHAMVRTTLADMFREEEGQDAGAQSFSVLVRDVEGAEVMSATLQFTARVRT